MFIIYKIQFYNRKYCHIFLFYIFKNIYFLFSSPVGESEYYCSDLGGNKQFYIYLFSRDLTLTSFEKILCTLSGFYMPIILSPAKSDNFSFLILPLFIFFLSLCCILLMICLSALEWRFHEGRNVSVFILLHPHKGSAHKASHKLFHKCHIPRRNQL